MEEEGEKTYDYLPFDEFYSEHCTTLMAYEMNFVNSMKP